MDDVAGGIMFAAASSHSEPAVMCEERGAVAALSATAFSGECQSGSTERCCGHRSQETMSGPHGICF